MVSASTGRAARRSIVVAAAAVALLPVALPAARPAAAAVTWTSVALSLDPSPTGNPINDRGVVAGSFPEAGDAPHVGAFGAVYDPAVRATVGVPYRYRFQRAVDVNGSDLVVGFGQPTSSGDPELMWTWKVGAPELTYYPRQQRDGGWLPAAISDAGFVVGALRVNGEYPAAALWDVRTGYPHTRLLKPLAAEQPSEALGITGTGYAVGQATDARGYTRPVVWAIKKGTVVDLGGLPGYDSGIAHDMNDSSFVVGESFLRADPTHRQAWVWNPKTHVTTALEGSSTDSAAYAINRYGVVAGEDGGVAAEWDTCVPRPHHFGGLAARAVDQQARTVVTTLTTDDFLGQHEVGVGWTRSGTCTAAAPGVLAGR